MTNSESIIETITESWGWTGIQPEAVIAENDFGNLIIKDKHGKYWRLCPEDVYCKVIASSDHGYEALIADSDFMADWSMDALVERARSKLGELSEGRKYHFVVPGVLGGEYEISKIKTAPLHEIIGISGDIGKQIEEVPDGAQIKLNVVD